MTSWAASYFVVDFAADYLGTRKESVESHLKKFCRCDESRCVRKNGQRGVICAYIALMVADKWANDKRRIVDCPTTDDVRRWWSQFGAADWGMSADRWQGVHTSGLRNEFIALNNMEVDHFANKRLEGVSVVTPPQVLRMNNVAPPKSWILFIPPMGRQACGHFTYVSIVSEKRPVTLGCCGGKLFLGQPGEQPPQPSASTTGQPRNVLVVREGMWGCLICEEATTKQLIPRNNQDSKNSWIDFKINPKDDDGLRRAKNKHLCSAFHAKCSDALKEKTTEVTEVRPQLKRARPLSKEKIAAYATLNMALYRGKVRNTLLLQALRPMREALFRGST